MLATGGLARNGCVRLEELTSDTLGACRVHFRLFPATPLAHALTNVGGGMYVPYPTQVDKKSTYLVYVSIAPRFRNGGVACSWYVTIKAGWAYESHYEWLHRHLVVYGVTSRFLQCGNTMATL